MVISSSNSKHIDSGGNDDALNFSDPEDYVDKITDEELLPQLMASEPRLDKSAEKMIVIDNIPKVGQDKMGKLKTILANTLAKFGKVTSEHYPEDENHVLKGYMFVEYENDYSAQDAVSTLNGYALDKSHKFKVNFLSDFEKYQNISSDPDAETPAPYKDPGNLMWWLTVNECYDQFALLHGDIFTSVYLNTPEKPNPLESREKWTETRFQWSPKGTYLATFHERGIALWAGENFKQFMRFAHSGVQLIDFSPCEKFIVTFNPNKAGVDDQALIIWCTRSGQKQRSFSCERGMNISWPYFRWNYDDKYFARILTDSLLIYETESFTLLDKKSMKIPHIADFEWSPTNNIISYWVAEDKNVPARVVLIDIPSKTEIRSKNLVNVVQCKMFWQSAGDYLCVRVERYKKVTITKDEPRYTGIYYNFEFFRMREKQIPVESINELKENCYSFAWEPNGQRFAIISGEMTSKTTGSFYKIVNPTQNVAGKIELIKEFKARSFLQVSWSPQGQYCAMVATTSKTSGQAIAATSCHAEFFEVQQNDVQFFTKVEHEHMSDFEWDPTGRYFVTYVSNWNYKIENAYHLYNFQGRLLHKSNFDKLYKFSWRPRPASLLTADQIKEIRKNIKTYGEKYSSADAKRLKAVSKELLEKRRKMMDDFSRFRRDTARRLNEQRAKRAELRNGTVDGEKNEEEIDQVVSFLLETKKEEIIE